MSKDVHLKGVAKNEGAQNGDSESEATRERTAVVTEVEEDLVTKVVTRNDSNPVIPIEAADMAASKVHVEHPNDRGSRNEIVLIATDPSDDLKQRSSLPKDMGRERGVGPPEQAEKCCAGNEKKRKEKQGVTIIVNFAANELKRKPVKPYLTQTFQGEVKFRMGKIEKKCHVFAVRIELENRDSAYKALVLLRSSDRNMIVDYRIDFELENCSDLNYELQMKSLSDLERHDARIGEEYKRLQSIIPVEATIFSKKELQSVMLERRNIEQKLMELTRQRDEFVIFMGCISNRLIGHETVGCAEAKLIRQSFGVECCRLKQALPMFARRGDIVNTVMSQQVTIVLGETGSGKSTQIVQYLYQAGFAGDGKIACTQPRKVAAVSLTERVSEEMKSRIGDVVGYKSGNRGKFGDQTKILYMTDYTLLTEFIQDPELSEYNCVVIDEAHERSLYTDIVLGMLKKLLLRRRELHIIISSATMDTKLFQAYFAEFDARVLEISGRTFPVEVVWPSRNWKGLSKFPVQDTIAKVREIHKTEEGGDILVFLTTPAETEKACELLSQDQGLECLPLHGKLQPQEQQRVFKPATAQKRKVVFATNCAETSITISGIKYVVDTGLVKENRFDPIRNMNTLDIGKTSKSSVEQRKGRAGRIEAGKCFRLFTEEEHKKMEASNKPEILRVQVGHAILSLMSAGVPNPLQFDFVQSPGMDALEAAMAELVSIGAVVDGSLTDLGRKISKLQLCPRLGKLVIEGIEQDIAMEAMVVASVCTMSGSMFFRMGSDEEKEKADIRKLPFCHAAGDLLTCMDVYRAWKDIDERRKNQWCFENSINAKAIRIIKETLMEMLRTLEREPGIQIKRAFKEDKEEADRMIQKSIFSCFKLNLCRFGGHQRIGYLSCQEGEQAGVLHPSSALRFLDQKPKWLVYDSILKTSQKFILNVTTVDDSWVAEAIKSGLVDIDLPRIEEKILATTRMAEFGYMVMKKLTENKYAVCNSLQKELTTKFDSPVFLEIRNAPGTLDIIAKKQHHESIKGIIKETVEPEKKSIKRKEIPGSLNGMSTRFVFGSGYQVNLVLGEGEYRSVLVKMDPSTHRDISKFEVLEYFAAFGEIRDHFIFNSQKSNKGQWNMQDKAIRWGKITFSTMDEAMVAVGATEGETVFAVPDLQGGKPRKDNHAEYLMRFKYCRRRSKGRGFVRFKSPDDAIRACSNIGSFRVRDSYASLKHDFQDDNLTKVFIDKIDHAADENELKTALHDALGCHNGSIEDIVLYREKSCDSKPTTQAEIYAFKRDMKEAIDDFLTPENREQYHINIKPLTKPGNIHLLGTIFFHTLEAFEMVAPHLPEGKKLCLHRNMERRFELTHHITTSFSVPREMYDAIETCFEEVNSILHEFDQHEMEVQFGAWQGNIIRISLSSHHARSHKQAIKWYQEILEGDQIPTHSPLMEFVFTTDGEKEMKHIMKVTGAYIALDKRMKTLSIHGSEPAREKAKIDLNGFLDKMEDNKPKVIKLQDEKQPKGLMKKVVQTFGCELQEVKRIPGMTEAVFDMRKRLLKVCGNDNALETVCQRVKELADEIGQGSPGDADEDEIACSVCFAEFEDNFKTMYRLQVCGHPYCLDCIKRQIEYARTNKEYPITCCGEDCQEPMALQDIWKIHPKQDEAVHTKLQMASLEAFVRKNRLKYRFCPTPNCQGVYKVTKNEDAIAVFRCELCSVAVCSCCHSQHPGISCRINKKFKEEEASDEAVLRKWKAQDPKKHKTCPKCHIMIEKTVGCNRMDCDACKTTFCWLCLEIFRSHNDCYDHLTKAHGGIFEVHELYQE
ncbi:uncharacterized protein LOC135495726 [Lineus longissimus]|uniref:uncharacterized protein LOC135495726 n=1 Tax=Lineus longissimus TaxID=88925 RepID=UPI00315CCA1C